MWHRALVEWTATCLGRTGLKLIYLGFTLHYSWLQLKYYQFFIFYCFPVISQAVSADQVSSVCLSAFLPHYFILFLNSNLDPVSTPAASCLYIVIRKEHFFFFLKIAQLTKVFCNFEWLKEFKKSSQETHKKLRELRYKE
jgi:hypothetical protein